MEIVQRLRQRYLQFLQVVVDVLTDEVSYRDFEDRLRQELDALGRDIVKWVVESCDERLREEPQARPGWVVARRGDEKQLLTPFGMVSYERTYFRHRARKQYAYLADAVIGVTPHQRVNDGVKARLVERAVEQSYRKSGRWTAEEAWHVSAQTVMTALRQTRVPDERKAPVTKRRVKYLFVEADEDHVPRQHGGRWQPRLVYVHEGWRERQDGRRELIRPHYFGGLDDPQELWATVWRYLEGHYDLEHVEAIFIAGDGAGWIRRGCEYMPKSVFVLDRYHVHKQVSEALGGDPERRQAVWRALDSLNAHEVQRLLREAYQQADSHHRRQAIRRTATYLRRNWDGIRAWRRYEGIWQGCSAEGHVSHVYAARLSSRPMAWSRVGVQTMARLRVWQANGGSARAAYLHGKPQPPLKVSSRWLQRLREEVETGRLLPAETLGNLPALRGHRTPLTRALRALSQFTAV